MSDLSNVSNEELMAAAERDAAGEERTIQWNTEFIRRCHTEVMKVNAAGEPDGRWPKMKVEDLDAALQRGYAKHWPAMVKAFKDGEYFGCQHFDFGSMLLATEEEIIQDERKWLLFDSTALAMGLGGSPELSEVRAFAFSRILMPHKNRQRYLDSEGRLRPIAGLTKEQQEGHERHRLKFEEAKQVWKWWWASPWPDERNRLKVQFETVV